MSFSAEKPHTFDNFIVKGSNRLAYLAFREFSAPRPSLGVRGLFLASSGPWGKTHLLEALAAGLPVEAGATVLKISASRLMDEAACATDENSGSPQLPWREAEAVLIDDLHLLAGQPNAQRLLVQIFDEAPAGRLVFSATSTPRDLSGLSEPLRSRLGGGLVLKIDPPEYELLLELAARKAARLNLQAADETLTAIIRQAGDDPRQISGLLETASFIIAKTGQNLEQAAKKLCPEKTSAPIAEQVNIEMVMNGVAEAFGLKKSDLTGHSKIRQAAWPRRVAMYLSREMTTLTTTEIGEAFGGRDHSTVIHALKKINEELKNPSQVKLVDNIRRSIVLGGQP